MIVDVQCEDDTIQIANLIRDENTHDVEVRFLKRIKNSFQSSRLKTQSSIPKVCSLALMRGGQGSPADATKTWEISFCKDLGLSPL